MENPDSDNDVVEGFSKCLGYFVVAKSFSLDGKLLCAVIVVNFPNDCVELYVLGKIILAIIPTSLK